MFFRPGTSYINSIIKTSDGDLWFGGGGVFRYHNDSWTTFNLREKFSEIWSGNIHSIFESSDGSIWFGTSGCVVRYHNGSWSALTIADGLICDVVYTIFESSDGAMWFGTAGGLNRYEQIWTSYIDEPWTNLDIIYTVFKSLDGSIWFGTYGGIKKYLEGNWKTLTAEDGLIESPVDVIFESSDSSMWFGTRKGLSRYYNDNFENFNADNVLTNDYILQIIETVDSKIWVRERAGTIDYYDKGIWKAFNAENRLINDCVNTLFESSDGVLWFGTNGGVNRLFQNKWDTLTVSDGLINKNVISIYESSDGAMWFGTLEGVSKYHNGQWTPYDTSNGLARNSVKDILESSDGTMWFSTGQWSLSRFFKGKFEPFFDENSGAENQYLLKMLEASNGAMWFGHTFGAYRYYQNIWDKYTTADGLVNSAVVDIVESSNGEMWFGTPKGISRLKPDRFPPLTIIDNGPKFNEIIGTSTPMFIFHGSDHRTPQDLLTYAYIVIDESSLLVAGDSLYFIKDTAVQPYLPGNGKYTFFVRAKDRWGNIDTTPAYSSFIIDVTPPTTTIEYPTQKDTVSQIIPIIGYAYDNSPIKDFNYYGVCYGKGTIEQVVVHWDTLVHRNSNEIRKDTLAIWNTDGLHGTYQLKLFAFDTLNHSSNDIISVHIVDATREIDSRKGGTITDLRSNIEIYFPPNSFSKNIELKISQVTDLNAENINNQKYRYAGLAYDVMPNNMTAKKNGTLTITYNDSNLTGIENTKKLSIFKYDENNDEWNLVGGTVQAAHQKVTTSINKLGRYGLFENLMDGTKHALTAIDCQPRMFSPKGGGYNTETHISFQLGKASDVSVSIFNVAGRVVNRLCENEYMNAGLNSIVWNGKDSSGKFCVSGLYVVIIQTEGVQTSKTVMVLNK